MHTYKKLVCLGLGLGFGYNNGNYSPLIDSSSPDSANWMAISGLALLVSDNRFLVSEKTRTAE